MPPHENPDPLEAVISRSSRRASAEVCTANAISWPKPSVASSGFAMTPIPTCFFSDARNRCYHNHGRFTLGGFHDPERHRDEWKTCPPCRDAFAAELYGDLGTNETHFERLENPPASKPTRCRVCHKRIRLGEDSYGTRAGRYICWSCGEAECSKR